MGEASKPVRFSVLVVEDDELVREATVGSVADLGHSVLEAPDADAALQMLEGDAVVDVLFTDVRLPGKSGEQLAREAWQRRPGLKVIFTSGGQAPDDPPDVTGVTVWLGKPYKWDDLKRAFERLRSPRD
ncbi:MAG TPA: response regulator [Stellaceae bacterium]|nr:response regulator [Stellaceae bacterium]